MSPMLTALAAMFLQQTFASVGKVLPAVLAPLVIAEFDADPAWVGVYYGVAACQTPSNRDPGSAWKRDPSPALGQALLRGKQDEKSASIGMRKCRRMRDEGRA